MSKISHSRWGLLGAVSVAALMAAPLTAQAQVSPGQVEEVVVTAQRREESLQSVPIAVTAVTGATLANRAISSSDQLESVVPGLSFTRSGTITMPYLRGVGSNAANPNDEPSVATYVDGVYIGSPIGNIFSFNNIERIEVLKGPQGTLFGRNATGGVIQLVTRKPQQTPAAEFKIGYGNYDTTDAAAYITGGLSDSVAADLAVIFNTNREGYGRNVVRNEDTMRHDEFAARSKVMWQPNDNAEIILSGNYSRYRSTGNDFQLPRGIAGVDGVPTVLRKYDTRANFKDRGDNTVYGFSLHINYDLEAFRLVSISASRKVKGLYQLDQDTTPLAVVDATINQRARTFSQEFQLLSPVESPVDWLIGAYYFNARYGYRPLNIAGAAAVGGFGVPSFDILGEQQTKSYSAYGQSTFKLSEALRLTAGLRYTDESQSLAGRIQIAGTPVFTPPDGSQSFKKLTWRLSADYQLQPGVMAYASYNRGVKSGGFNLLGPGEPGYRPEVLDAFEVGLKSDLFDRRLRLNLSAFYYDYKDIQVQIIRGAAVSSTNAAKARIKGLEAEFQAVPMENLTISGGAGYLDGEYTDYKTATFTPASPLFGPQTVGDASGNDVVNAPHFTGNLGMNYRIPLTAGHMDFGANAAYRSRAYTGADNRLAVAGYTLVNATAGWSSLGDRYGVQLWVKNLFDVSYLNTAIETSLGDVTVFGPPRTYGVSLSAKF